MRSLGATVPAGVPDHDFRQQRAATLDRLALQLYESYRRSSLLQLVVAVVLLGVALEVVIGLGWTGKGPGQVPLFYQGAAQAIVHGASPYSCAVEYLKFGPEGWKGCYVYPPLLATLLIPIAYLPFGLFAVIWELFILACGLYVTKTVLDLVLPNRRLAAPARVVLWLLVFDVVFLFGPLRQSLRNAEVDVVIIAAIIMAWHALSRGQRVRSGLLMALAVAIKPNAALVLGYYLWKREWRAALTASVGSFVGILAPFLLLNHQAIHQYLQVSSHWATAAWLLAPKSFSLFGVVDRILYMSPSLWRILATPLTAKVVEAGLALGSFLGATYLMRRFSRAEVDTFAFGLIILVVLLGSPLTEDIHLALAVIPLAIAARSVVRRFAENGRRRWLTFACISVIYVLFFMPATVFDQLVLNDSGVVGALTAMYWFYPLAALTGLYLYLANRGRPVQVAR